MNPNQAMGPTAGRERLVHLDILRGFALLGILMVNFQYFTQPILAIMLGADPSLEGADRIVDWWIHALFESKFYALFSLLFGIGFALIWERAEDAGRSFYGLYLRRLAILAVFGLAHGALIWAGDILLVYALTGFLMTLLFRRTPRTRLPKWAIAFLAVPVLMMWLFTITFELSKVDEESHAEFVASIESDQAQLRSMVEEAAPVYSEGSYAEVTAQRISDTGFLFTQALFWVTPVLGYFLLGRWMLVSGRLREPAEHPVFFRKLRTWVFVLGLVLCLGAARLLHGLPFSVPDLRLASGMTLLAVGAPLLMLGYVGLVVHFRAVLAWLAPAGRMALTNYLVQSAFWTTMFYGYGLGLWGGLPRIWHPLLVVGFFALQVAFSHWWLARFRFGPAEWLWRSLTYLRLQPMRR